MKTVTKIINTDIGKVELTIDEYPTKKEIVKLIQDWKNCIKICEKLNQDPDMYISILYEDGSYYSRSYHEEDGKFRYTRIKAVNMNDGWQYYTYGQYVIDEETAILTVE